MFNSCYNTCFCKSPVPVKSFLVRLRKAFWRVVVARFGNSFWISGQIICRGLD